MLKAMNKQKIEVFTAGCPVCQPVIELVKSLENEEFNEITVYDLVKNGETTECVSKLEEYGIKRLPAIAINGQLLDSCKNNGITKKDLIGAGLKEKI
jgi:hypothetical protein